MVAQNLMQLLVSFNNVGKDSQVCNATSRPSNIRYTETHTQKDKWVHATKDEPKCGIHKNALVAQHQRDASTIAQQADTKTCAQPTKQKCNDFYPKYALCKVFL